LKAELENPQSPHHRVMQRLKALIAIRRRQPAFHPNAIQFTLHLGEALFGYWRQSIDRRQSIFCIYNISDQEQTLSLPSINLTVTDHWFDLIRERAVESQEISMNLAPYQALWISNHDGEPRS
jgi:sucrose phosphorylase